MKDKIFLIILAYIFSFVVHAKESNFEHTLRIEPASVYSKIHLSGNVAENHSIDIYQKDKNLSLEGELKFLDVFSIKLAGGKTKYQETDQKPISQWDRLNVGLKFAKENGVKNNRVVYGSGIRIFLQESNQNPRTQNSPNLYLVKPHFSFGWGIGDFEIQTEFAFQTETNSKFKESAQEEFRRNYIFGLSVSYGLTDWFRLLFETEYLEPYQKKIDTNIGGWYAYPGFMLSLFENGRLGVSLQFPISKQDYLYERGLKISYIHYFN